MKLSKLEIKMLNDTASNKVWVLGTIIKMWNHDAPHFGGGMPHRYDDEKSCSYCGRPKNWKPRNVFFDEDGKELKP